MIARVATLADIEGVHALLASAGVHVERGSLERRTEGPDGGILLASGATLSWVIDGRALHLYDLAGEPAGVQALIELAKSIAHEQLAVALVCALYEGDPIAGFLEAAGFERDWEEREVHGGSVRNLITFLRVLEDI